MSKDRQIVSMSEKHAKELAERDAASDANLALAHAQVAAMQAKYNTLAKDAQHAYELGAQSADTSLARYVAANRVRSNQVCRSNPAAASERSDPGVPADLPPDSSLVAIRELELQALVEWVKVGVAAHNMAVDKINAGVAVPVELPAF
jgi:hypothetical protein